MPLFMIFAGVILVIAAIRGKQKDLFDLLKDDFTGSGNYFVWVIAVGFLVALGYIDKLKPVSNAFLTLVILVIILSNSRDGRNIFASFFDQIRDGTKSGGQTNIGDSLGNRALDNFSNSILKNVGIK